MTPVTAFMLSLLIQIASIPIIALILKYAAGFSKLKDTSYKTALKATATIIGLSLLFAVFLSFLLPNLAELITTIISLFLFFIIVPKFYKVPFRKCLKLFLYYVVIRVVLLVIILTSFFLINSVLNPSVPNIVSTTCRNECIGYPDFQDYEVKKEDDVYACYCIWDDGNRIRTLQLPVNYDWNGFTKNISVKSKEIRENTALQQDSLAKPRIDDVMPSNRERVYVLAEEEYAVRTGSIDATALTAAFDINGESFTLDEGTAHVLSDGTHLFVHYIADDFNYDGENVTIVKFTLWKE